MTYSLVPRTCFQVIDLILSSTSPENKSLQSLTHLSTELTWIHSTLSSLDLRGVRFAICTPRPGRMFISSKSGPSLSSSTTSHPRYFIPVIFCTCTDRESISSQNGSLIHLTSQIPGIVFTTFDHFVIKVSLPVQMSIQTQHAPACRLAFPSDSAVGTRSIAITGTMLYTMTRMSGSQNFQRRSTSFAITIFFSIITLSLQPEREKNPSSI